MHRIVHNVPMQRCTHATHWYQSQFHLDIRIHLVPMRRMGIQHHCAAVQYLVSADLEIASIAIANQLILVTGNTRHF